jgi:hypothetical protein
MFGNIIGDLTGHKGARLKGSLVLMRKSVLNLDVTSVGATVLDNVTEFLGRGVTCQLISSTVTDPSESLLVRLPSYQVIHLPATCVIFNTQCYINYGAQTTGTAGR